LDEPIATAMGFFVEQKEGEKPVLSVAEVSPSRPTELDEPIAIAMGFLWNKTSK